MSGRLEHVKKIQPIYKSPDKWDKHLAMHVKRGMQGSWDRKKYKDALTPFECMCHSLSLSRRSFAICPIQQPPFFALLHS